MRCPLAWCCISAVIPDESMPPERNDRAERRPPSPSSRLYPAFRVCVHATRLRCGLLRCARTRTSHHGGFDLVVVKVEQVRGRDCVNALEQCVWIRRPQKRQKLVEGFGVERRLDQFACENRFDFRPEDKRRRRFVVAGDECVVQRLDRRDRAPESECVPDCPKRRTTCR